jgi:hypothetical protein
MKTIVENASGESKYLLEDDGHATMFADRIVLQDGIVCDLNASNATLYENVTPPEDWAGCKYLFDGTNWTLNPSWVDPTPQPQPE